MVHIGCPGRKIILSKLVLKSICTKSNSFGYIKLTKKIIHMEIAFCGSRVPAVLPFAINCLSQTFFHFTTAFTKER